MKSSHLISIALAFATISLSLPAHADEVNNDSVQSVTVSGTNNTVNQRNNTTVRGGNRDRSTTTVRSTQDAQVDGQGNTINQNNNIEVDRHQQRNR